MAEDPTESFAPADGAVARPRERQRNDVAEALVVPLVVIVFDVLANERSQVLLTERDDVPQALGLDRTDEALGVRVQVRASRRKAKQLHVGGREQRLELGRVQRVPVHDQVASLPEEAARHVGEVAADLRHPRAVGAVREAGRHERSESSDR